MICATYQKRFTFRHLDHYDNIVSEVGVRYVVQEPLLLLLLQERLHAACS